ncbi:MAG: vWA domain-containing protein, partial [Burkholderiaceae bacterium]
MYSIPKNIAPLQSQRGSVSIIIAFMLIVIIGFAGLAIDTGRHYGIKAKLSAASDAAAIAGARALATGTTQAERIANAEAVAERYFNLNYPTGFKRSMAYTPTTSVVPAGNGRWSVTVNARASNPNFFMGILGHGDTNIRTVSQAIRVNPDIMMVLDSSGSMDGFIAPLQDAAKSGFVNKFISDPDGDRLGVVQFASGAVITQPIDKTASRGFNRSAVNRAINNLSQGGWTATSDAMRKAMDDLNAIPQGVRSTLRVMLVFSDGAPNMVATQRAGQLVNISRSPWGSNRYYRGDRVDSVLNGDLNMTMPTTALGGIAVAGRLPVHSDLNDVCNAHRAGRNLTENMADMARSQGVVVYTIGLGSQLESIEWAKDRNYNDVYCGGMTSEDIGTEFLKRLANDRNSSSYNPSQFAGQFCYARTADELEPCFSQIANDILRLT